MTENDITLVKYLPTDDILWQHIGRFGFDPAVRSELGGVMSSDDDTHWVVALANGDSVAGFAALKQRQKRLSHLYVLPMYRRRGLAGQLIEERIAIAREIKLPYVMTAVRPERTKHYTACGFHDAYRRGRWHWMRLYL